MTRRELLALACCWPARGPAPHPTSTDDPPRQAPAPPESFVGDGRHQAPHRRAVARTRPERTVKTLAYNGQVPGPLLRARQGRPITIDVWNDTRDEDIVHWHGFHIPSEVDGVYEEGTPGVPPNGGRRRYVIDAGPGRHPLVPQPQHGRDATSARAPTPDSSGCSSWSRATTPAPTIRKCRSSCTSGSRTWPPTARWTWSSASTRSTARCSARGEPIRVKPSQRVLFRIVNASATLHHRLALPGHRFRVLALDGNAVPTPTAVPVARPRARGTRGRGRRDEPPRGRGSSAS